MCALNSLPSGARPRVVIVGGGFAGLNCAISLRKSPVDVTLVDRRNFHLFQPLLYQVATGGLSPANIAAPLRWILRKQKNCEVVLGQVVGFDLERRLVFTEESDLPFDWLVVAAGARHSYFGNEEWAELAPGLKTIEEATNIRGRVFSAFEHAERMANEAHRRALLNFAIVGGGPTGVELAGALAEIARQSLKHDFRRIDPSDAQIMLVEAGPRVLAAYPESLSKHAAESLTNLGVTVRTATRVTAIRKGEIDLQTVHGVETWPTHTVLWAAGVQASPLAKALAAASGAEIDRCGRLTIGADLSVAGFDRVFALGDMANCVGPDGQPLPGVAPVAIQQGTYVARSIDARLRGEATPAFRYRDLGSLATIGKRSAVARFGKWQFAGFFAWVLWLVIHLMKIVAFRNRILVLMQWAWNYFTNDRSARLITGAVPNDADLAALEELVNPASGVRRDADPPPKR